MLVLLHVPSQVAVRVRETVPFPFVSPGSFVDHGRSADGLLMVCAKPGGAP
jgi:hypothetical protein